MSLLRVFSALALCLLSGGGLSYAAADDKGVLADAFIGRAWEIDEGYPDVTATSFAQTADGYLWIGTFTRLLRFDGVKFVEVQADGAPQLERCMILDLTVDGADNLWLGTSLGVGSIDKANGPGLVRKRTCRRGLSEMWWWTDKARFMRREGISYCG
ncbi:MAG: hypothetical protein J6386_13625 [Candidatus Synoicihabitans palmerolidicus]|nr:hypothetical protein [Candidatus Synoicihabitans palmerolidicus]